MRGEIKKKIQGEKKKIKKLNNVCDKFQIHSKVMGGKRRVIIIIYAILVK